MFGLGRVRVREAGFATIAKAVLLFAPMSLATPHNCCAGSCRTTRTGPIGLGPIQSIHLDSVCRGSISSALVAPSAVSSTPLSGLLLGLLLILGLIRPGATRSA